MKKLNRKGFTLIELLAVIVILAIIVVVTVPTILNSINDARSSTIHSLSKEFANWYDTSYAQDLIAIDPNSTLLKGAKVEESDGWKCIKEIKGTGDNLAVLYNLSGADVKLDGTKYSGTGKPTTDTCSSIRLNNGRAEVIIVGEPNGKFGKRYAISTSDKSDSY